MEYYVGDYIEILPNAPYIITKEGTRWYITATEDLTDTSTEQESPDKLVKVSYTRGEPNGMVISKKYIKLVSAEEAKSRELQERLAQERDIKSATIDVHDLSLGCSE